MAHEVREHQNFDRLSRGERARLWSARCRRWWSSIADSLHVKPHDEKAEENDIKVKDKVQEQEMQKVKVEAQLELFDEKPSDCLLVLLRLLHKGEAAVRANGNAVKENVFVRSGGVVQEKIQDYLRVGHRGHLWQKELLERRSHGNHIETVAVPQVNVLFNMPQLGAHVGEEEYQRG
ncbi:hypothetical protein TYRP_023687 [Tyrophagus putrescentiae]|nr:hypothetical protein TYRP_023687 [Tyrophagus putrescentiae]